METVIGGLVLAAVTGLAILAYRHPEAYRFIGRILMLAVGVIGLQQILFAYGALRSDTRTLQKLLEEQPEMALRIVAGSVSDAYTSIQFISLAVAITFAIEFYLILLWWLPAILQLDAEAKASAENLAELRRSQAEIQRLLEKTKKYDNPVEPRPEKEKNKG